MSTKSKSPLKEIIINKKKFLFLPNKIKPDTGLLYDYDIYNRTKSKNKSKSKSKSKSKILLKVGRLDRNKEGKLLIYLPYTVDNNWRKVLLSTKYIPKIERWKQRALEQTHALGGPGYEATKRNFKKLQKKSSRAKSLPPTKNPRSRSISKKSRKIKST